MIVATHPIDTRKASEIAAMTTLAPLPPPGRKATTAAIAAMIATLRAMTGFKRMRPRVRQRQRAGAAVTGGGVAPGLSAAVSGVGVGVAPASAATSSASPASAAKRYPTPKWVWT